MGGPGIIVVLGSPIDDVDARDRIQRCLAAAGEVVRKGDKTWDLYPDPASWDRGPYGDEPICATTVAWRNPVSDGPEWEYEIDEALGSAFRDAFQMTPVEQFYVDADCPNPIYHSLAARAAVALAREFSGVIDFNGVLLPPLPRDLSLSALDWRDLAPDAQQMFEQMPGRILAVPYAVDDTRLWAQHISDVDFLVAWMAHPHFHLVK